MTIRAITFDFWGTLFRDAHGTERHGLRVKALTDATHISEKDADETLKEIMAYFLQMHIETQHTLTPRDAVHLACNKFDICLEENTVNEIAHIFGTAILTHPPEPIVDALAAVQSSAERVPVAIISDTGFSPGKKLSVLLEREGFLSCFSALTFSDETGVAKPQRFMFESTAEKLGVAPHELMHIGDLEPTDIVGAHQVNSVAGLFTAVNNRYADTTRADYILPSWSHFLELLPELV
jgi:HAD superfamily hydrolase (TIGR01549 family)